MSTIVKTGTRRPQFRVVDTHDEGPCFPYRVEHLVEWGTYSPRWQRVSMHSSKEAALAALDDFEETRGAV